MLNSSSKSAFFRIGYITYSYHYNKTFAF